MHITKTQTKSHTYFYSFQIFLNILHLTAFLQHVISKFVKVLPQKLNNLLLEKSRARFCAAAC